jgi:exosome complex RNA-binding protein Csl4
MVNYGYDDSTENWKEEKKHVLANELGKLLHDMNKEGKINNDYMSPYIEMDQLYRGVRIRKITHLTAKIQDELIKRADAVYTRIMTLKKERVS